MPTCYGLDGLNFIRRRQPVKFGSSSKCHVQLLGEGISPEHALLSPTGTGRERQVEMESLDPANSVRINGEEVIVRTLRDGDRIQIGKYEITYTNPLFVADEWFERGRFV